MVYRLLGVCLLAGLAAVALAEPAAEPEVSVADKMKAKQQESLPDTHRASIDKRKQLSKRIEGTDLHQFKQKDGSVTFTNRPE
jgi:hypothetical protein